jgi:hypothetical protein
MANYYVNSRKLVGDGTNEDCILTQYNNSLSNLSNRLNVGSSIFSKNGSNYMINTNNTLSFYETNYNSLKCNLSSGYNVSSNTDITENALISYRIHDSGTINNFSCNGANKLKVLLVGGGGGGGGNTRSNNRNRRGKGGGGAGGLILFDVDLPIYTNNYYIEIGGGGNGSKNGDNTSDANCANDGQKTTFIISGWRVNAYGGSKTIDSYAGTGGNTTTPSALPTDANITIIYSESGVGGSDGQGNDTGSTWGGRGGTYTFSNLNDFPSVISTHANPNNNNSHTNHNLVAENNQGYNTNQTTNGYGIGGGGAGGSNKNNATTNVLPGAHGGDGLGIVFFRYD